MPLTRTRLSQRGRHEYLVTRTQYDALFNRAQPFFRDGDFPRIWASSGVMRGLAKSIRTMRRFHGPPLPLSHSRRGNEGVSRAYTVGADSSIMVMAPPRHSHILDGKCRKAFSSELSRPDSGDCLMVSTKRSQANANRFCLSSCRCHFLTLTDILMMR